MRLKSSDLLFGIKADQLRHFFKHRVSDEFTFEYFSEEMHLTKKGSN